MIAGLTLPRQFMRPNVATPTPSGARPASTATLAIVEPPSGQVVPSKDAQLDVVMTLDGGHIVDTASTTLTPDTGHIHLSLDGTLVSMTYGLVQLVESEASLPASTRSRRSSSPPTTDRSIHA